jgi:hypothetical protein
MSLLPLVLADFLIDSVISHRDRLGKLIQPQGSTPRSHAPDSGMIPGQPPRGKRSFGAPPGQSRDQVLSWQFPAGIPSIPADHKACLPFDKTQKSCGLFSHCDHPASHRPKSSDAKFPIVSLFLIFFNPAHRCSYWLFVRSIEPLCKHASASLKAEACPGVVMEML